MPLENNTSGHLFDTTFTTNGTLYSASSGVVTSAATGNSGEIWTSIRTNSRFCGFKVGT
jgi:hypothetical protein